MLITGRVLTSAALSLSLSSLACAGGDRGAPFALVAIDSLPSPAAPGSAEPNLHVARGNQVLLTWIEPQPDSAFALRLAALEGDRWSSSRTITRSESLFVNWADFPSVMTLPNGHLIAHWLQKSGAGKYAYNVRVARSLDSGTTWTRGSVLHTDRSEAEHGFVALWPESDSVAGAAWLDGRRSAGPQATMMLMSANTTGDTSWSERSVDTRVCDCCQTAAALTARGPVVVYRDRSTAEIRDIAILRRVDGRWLEPKAVHDDGWHIEACPVNGPAVDASAERVAVAWFTAARDTARVHVAFSSDAGATFGAPIRIDDGTPAGRVGIVLDAEGGAFVSWIERTGGENAEVRVRHVSVTGSLSDPVAVATSSAARASGFPRMVRAGHALIFAWTAPGSPSTVRVARAKLDQSR
ncbi:MAG TPA: hypothetical protein VJ672_04735 [Gemmatimonadaceae bacterium]|nr:hypothetical protein [Gemmatimonadaceae bacterium]